MTSTSVPGSKTDTDFTSGSARLDWDFDGFSLVSITNFQDFSKHQIQDCDSGSMFLLRFLIALPTTPRK